MSGVVPTHEQVQRLSEMGPEGPVVMVNLLKYRKKAAYEPNRPEAAENLTGEQAYRRYGSIAVQHVTAWGGSIVWGGAQSAVVIGDDYLNEWDEVVCVRYPSREAFLKMARDPDYLACHYHREAALSRAALLCCSAGTAT